MPPPPLKLYKVSFEKEAQIEQMLLDLGFTETLEAFRNERNKRSRVPTDVGDNGNFIEKKGDVWACTFCDKTFTTKGSAKRHLLSTHSADSKQFECPRCTSKFARRDDLYTHLRRMHGANQLVEMMIEEHKAELKGEHKGTGMGKLMSVVSHNEHLDVILPSGATICRPLAIDVSSADPKEPMKAAKACRAAKCTHWRVIHDGHEDVLVNGALHHKNEEGEWECHGELGSLEDFEFLLTSAQAIEDNGASAANHSHEHANRSHDPSHDHSNDHAHSHDQGHHGHDHAILETMSHGTPQFFRTDSHILDLKSDHGHGHDGDHHEYDLNLQDFDFFLSGMDHQHPGPGQIANKQTVESLLLPGGSVFCRRIALPTGSKTGHVQWSSNGHKHGLNCGHPRVRHGNHYDYLVGNVIESEHGDCIMHGTTVLEQNDSATLSYVVSALVAEQQQQKEAAAEAAAGSAILAAPLAATVQ